MLLVVDSSVVRNSHVRNRAPCESTWQTEGHSLPLLHAFLVLLLLLPLPPVPCRPPSPLDEKPMWQGCGCTLTTTTQQE